MTEVAKRGLIWIGKFIIGSIIVHYCVKAADNICDGKTVTGKKRKAKKDKTYVDWRGQVILSENDGSVV